jgi:hypothetical protein
MWKEERGGRKFISFFLIKKKVENREFVKVCIKNVGN